MKTVHCKPIVNSILFILAIFLLIGCAGGKDVQISKQAFNSIESITINPEIAQPETPYVQGANNLAAFLIGGGVGAAAETKKAGEIFKQYMDRNNIDISLIVYEQFKKIILENKIFELNDNSNIELKLVINTYGFAKSSAFSFADRRPLMNVKVSLIKDGTDTIWEKTDFITNMSGLTDTYTFDQLAKDPKLTVKSFEQISTILAKEIFSDLKK